MQGGYFTSSGFVPDSEPQTAVARAYSASDTADAGSPAQKTVPTVQTQGASDTADQAVSEMIRLGRLDKQLAASSDPGNAATVNGAAITKKQFDSYKATIASTNPAAAQSDRELLDALIDQELIYEQAVKAGYLATDAQVSSEITQSKQLMSQDPNQSRITRAYIAAQGLTEDQYWVNQQSAMKRSMTVTGYENKLRSDYMKQHASSNYNQTAQGFYTYLSGLEKQWRSGAKIVYYYCGN